MLMSYYRPYTKQWLYFDKHFNGMTYQWFNIFNNEFNNIIIGLNVGSDKFVSLVSNHIIDLACLLVSGGGTQCLPLYYYEKEGNRIDNITDWGLQQFQKHYNDKNLTKLDIFHYTYAVLHYPEYRSKYELNLKREFPRLPFYDNFYQWVEWGSKLMELHINYETVEPYPLTRIDTNNNLKPKTKLKADREKNSINLDDITFLQDIPKIAWEYKLGNRSALEWILDQYKEKKPKDQTIAERFNNYRFADYKETVIDLLQRVCTVSVETMKIIEAMRH
jgi:predicted helicase